MSQHFYTSFCSHGSDLLLRGVLDGKHYKERRPIEPYLFIPSKTETGFRTLYGKPVQKKMFSNSYAAYKYLKANSDIQGFEIYGITHHDYVAIHDMFPGNIEYDISKLRRGTIDIECRSDDGFPHPDKAEKEITAITFKVGKWRHVFGCGDFVSNDPYVIYYKCRDELQLIDKFLLVWNKVEIDIVTGWNINAFDLPYIVNRIRRLWDAEHSEKYVKLLSPWGIVKDRMVKPKEPGRKEYQVYDLYGISTLDYMELYKKFATKLESNTLNYVAHHELGIGKIDYSEFESLDSLYKNDYQKFIEYNIKDVDLIDMLEERCGLIAQVVAFAYDAKVNFPDTLTTVLPWDIIIHNYLLDQGIVVPPKKHNIKADYEGAFVKEPIVGRHEWIVSFDLTSLYPMLIWMYNIGPETFAGFENDVSIDKLLNKEHDTESLVGRDLAMAANGTLYRRDKQSFLAALMERLFNDRDAYKKKMLDAQKDLVAIEEEIKRRGLVI